MISADGRPRPHRAAIPVVAVRHQDFDRWVRYFPEDQRECFFYMAPDPHRLEGLTPRMIVVLKTWGRVESAEAEDEMITTVRNATARDRHTLVEVVF